MIGSILKRVTKVKPANLAITRGIITETGAIQKMPQGINKFSPIAVPIVVALGCCAGFKASEGGAWLLREFSLFEYDDDDDDD
ncbi:hypothetical protein ACHWQZ_G004032 [Mnemiopsis leidyi]